MAVLEQIECNITIDGVKTPEYDCPREHDASVANKQFSSGPVIDKYIESQPDRNFTISIRLQKEFRFANRNAVQFYFYVDGAYMENAILDEQGVRVDGDRSVDCEGPVNNVRGAGVLQRFRFSRLSTGKRSESIIRDAANAFRFNRQIQYSSGHQAPY